MKLRPRPFVEEIVRDLPPGRALDLACGNGRNAAWLAERGWDVTAVDRAPTFEHPTIHVRVADLEKHEFVIQESAWDLIVVSYYLQPDLFVPILRGLRPNGIVIVIVHLFEPGHEASRFSLNSGELRPYFQGETILAYREGKPAGDPEARSVAQIAVRR
jgi:SAM-dependent methyltransferase